MFLEVGRISLIHRRNDDITVYWLCLGTGCIVFSWLQHSKGKLFPKPWCISSPLTLLKETKCTLLIGIVKLFHMDSPVFWISSYSKGSFKLILPTVVLKSVFLQVSCLWNCNKSFNVTFLQKIFLYQNWRYIFILQLKMLTLLNLRY